MAALGVVPASEAALQVTLHFLRGPGAGLLRYARLMRNGARRLAGGAHFQEAALVVDAARGGILVAQMRLHPPDPVGKGRRGIAPFNVVIGIHLDLDPDSLFSAGSSKSAAIAAFRLSGRSGRGRGRAPAVVD